jgi:hypothetical protein
MAICRVYKSMERQVVRFDETNTGVVVLVGNLSYSVVMKVNSQLLMYRRVVLPKAQINVLGSLLA